MTGNEYSWDYEKCMTKYADINDNFANFTTLPPTLPTTTETKGVKPEEDDTLLPTILGGSLGGFVFLCCFIICCLCLSKRSEHRKRAEIEEQYKVVATTLTNITDSEDGCTYETLSMIDPTYRGIELPTRKTKPRLDGVSNGLAVFKRWMSVEGENESASVLPDYKRSQPLPAIPEPNGRSSLAREIDEYTEIGSENIRNHAHFVPRDPVCDKIFPEPNGNPYDRLRQSTLMSNCTSETADQNLNKDDYFILENSKQIINGNSENPVTTGPYFVLENTSKDQNGKNTSKSGGGIPTETLGENNKLTDPNKNDMSKTVERRSVENKTSVNDSCNINGDPYFVLEKTVEAKQEDRLTDSLSSEDHSERPNSYMEPIERDYLEVLPEDRRCDPVNMEKAVGKPENQAIDSIKNDVIETGERRESVGNSISVDDGDKRNSDAYFVLEKKVEPPQNRLKDGRSSGAYSDRPASYLEPIHRT